VLHRSAALLLALASGVAGADTAWPPSMPGFTRGLAESSVAATLPEGIALVAPGPEVPPARARFAGLWRGWACRNAACDVKIAVEQVSATNARIVYAGANAVQGLITDRAEASFEGDELVARLRTGARLVMRLRADGDMEMSLWRPDSTLLSVGVLSQQPPDHERRIERVPTSWSEQGAPVTLEMVVFRPTAGGPFPTLVFNHGSTGNGDRPELFTLTYTAPEIARFFVRQGWQVVFPQRRGRGKSGGLYDEGFEPDRKRYACEAARSLPGLERAIEDLDAVMAHLRTRADVDARRMMIGGVSRGGILSAVYAGTRPGAFLGVVNFVGGWVGDRCADADDVNGGSFKRAAAFPRPMLWLYGEKDPFYAVRHSRRNHEAFVSAGGQGEFLVFDAPAGDNGHNIVHHPSIWRPALERYLRERMQP
jgi:dienelactone hydrolase